jgi:two-component system, cell cycle response regulator
MSDDHKEHTVITNIPDLGQDKKKKHAYIIFLSGPLIGKVHLLKEGALVVGRAPDVDIPIDDLGISRHHITLITDETKVILRDLGSTNGTFVNGTRVTERELQDGDKVQVSSSTIIKFAYQDQIEDIFHNELYKMATIDPLTSAYNKRFFANRLKEEFSYALRKNIPLTLVMMDIDHFKTVNDSFGHPAGDFALGHLATLTRTVIRNEDIFARYGGEEFAIILKSTEKKGAGILCERLRRLIEESEFKFEDNILPLTVSIGFATLNDKNFGDHEAILNEADRMLYQSKEGGRNLVSASSI